MPAKTIIEHNNVRYRVRVSVGPTTDPKAQQPINVNDDSSPVLIETDDFVGHVLFRIKGQDQVLGYEQGQKEDGLQPVPDSKWFKNISASGRGDHHLSSFQVVGRFKREWPADQILFGSTFDRPLRLPPLTSLAIKFVRALDSASQFDVQCPKPYFLSPILATMTTVNVTQCKTDDKDASSMIPKWPSFNGEPLVEDTSLIVQEQDAKKKSKIVSDTPARRSFFSKAKHLSNHQIRNDLVYGFELFNPFLDCSNLSLKLPGFSLDLFKVFDGQPLTYVIKTKDGSVTFLALSINLVPVDALGDI
ncbi:hypothetical protein BGZ51_004944 [Haplosporangium sp. Z 767]|nr:hypothetical protein BGZ51_004944 [Haplosporangium sp. Z 767]